MPDDIMAVMGLSEAALNMANSLRQLASIALSSDVPPHVRDETENLMIAISQRGQDEFSVKQFALERTPGGILIPQTSKAKN